MITNRRKLRQILSNEFNLYSNDYDFSLQKRLQYKLLLNRRWRIWKWQKMMRKADYYRHTTEGFSLFNKLAYIFFSYRRNVLGEKLGFDFVGYGIEDGLQIYHANVVINNRAKIGKNLHLHGENVIGNDGINIEACPIIGDNVMLGAGAKIFGNVKIANNIKIGAGAIVVSSFIEEGITIAGIPAKKIK